MLHVFSEALQEAQRLIKYDGHRNLGEFLFNKKKYLYPIYTANLTPAIFT